ncbi:MAG: ABC transporter permease [Defluviitaleaceae bacterium]|nr:ABC transporter permease [Defluviitaleaceae bacterium]
MSLTAKLALQQLKKARKRTMWTLAGISLSVAMIVAVNGFAASALAMFAQDGRTIDIWERTGILFTTVVLGVVIAAASIIVISNAFRVSAVERIRQFGILKSIGATKKQISATVMYEALFLCVIGLPLGIIMGLVTQFIATTLANHVLEPARIMFPAFHVSFPFIISGIAMAIASVGALVMILISAWLPARKAAKAPAVQAIMGDVKIKKYGKFGISRLLFGFEGQLAASQLKRSRHNFRASVVSISISIILLLGAASARVNLLRQVDMMHEGIDANVRIFFWVPVGGFQHTTFTDEYGHYYIRPGEGEWVTAYDQDGNIPRITNAHARETTQRLREFPGADVRGYGSANYTHMVSHNGDYIEERIWLITVSDELYATIAEAAGVELGSNILINIQRYTDIFGVTHEANPHGGMVGTNINIYQVNYFTDTDGSLGRLEIPDTRRDIYIHGQVAFLPDSMLYLAYWQPTIVVQDMPVSSYQWFIQTDNIVDFMSHAQYVKDLSIVGGGFSILPLDFVQAEREVLSNLATVFVGGFVGMLTLIGVTNVISTISTNTKLRVREFAILTSVGMTQGGIGKMLALESILCSARALVYGLPLGALAAYGVYYGTQMDRVRFSFIFPWQALALCIAGVFVITFFTTMFSAYRLRGANIIEAIR